MYFCYSEWVKPGMLIQTKNIISTIPKNLWTEEIFCSSVFVSIKVNVKTISKTKIKRKLVSIFCCTFYLGKACRPAQIKTKPEKNYFPSTSSQFGAHSQSPCYSEQTCAARFASHLNSHKMYYSEWNSTIRSTYLEQYPTPISSIIRSGTLLYGVPTWNSTLLRLVLGIGILLGLVQEVAFGEDYVLEICGGTFSEV